MSEILYYIFIFPLEQVLDWLLLLLYKGTQNYGISIMLLSLLVNLFLLKISLYTDRRAKQDGALKAKLDKRIKAWKGVYSKAKLYAFTQTLYRQHSYHPIYALRGLFGLALQIPFFIAILQLVNHVEVFNGVSFLWISDLSKPDVVVGIESLHLLPLIMTALTLINVFYSVQERGARIQGTLIALFFLVLLYNMPSALVLYWSCNMAFSLMKEVVKKWRGKRDRESLENTSDSMAQSLAPTTQNAFSQNALTQIPRAQIPLKHTPQNAFSQNALKHTPHKYKAKQNLFYELTKYSIINLALMICLFNPYTLFASDLNAFTLKTIPLTLACLFGVFLLSTLCLCYLFSLLRRGNIIAQVFLALFAYIFTALILMALVYNFFLRGDYGLMSDFVFNNALVVSPSQKRVDTIVIPILLVSAFVVLYFRKYVIYLHKILAIVLIIGTLVPLGKTISHIAQRSSAQAIAHSDSSNVEVLNFSKTHNNILMLILDRSDGYSTHEIFKENPRLASHFDGFIDFTQALSAGEVTSLALTSMIAGEHYTAINMKARKVSDTQDEIARGYASTFNAFEREGYIVSATIDHPTDEIHLYPKLDNPSHILFDVTPLTNYYVKTYLAGNNGSKIPIVQLLSYGLFQLSYYQLRFQIYRKGVWLANYSASNSIINVAVLSSLADITRADATKPTFHFIHNNITHNPYILDSACNIDRKNTISPKDSEYGLYEGHYNSERCAYQWVANILDRLKKIGVYDNTEIFITADHGGQYKFLPAKLNLHIPLFYKPLHAKGAMKQDSRIITNYDIPTIFCANLKHGCPNVASNILKTPPQSREIHAATIEWDRKNQGETIFKGNNIYDPNAWHTLSQGEEHE